MKYTKILLALLSCSSLSCSDMEFVETDPSGSSDSYSSRSISAPSGNVSLQTVQLSSLQSGTNNLLGSLRTTPNSYLFSENGVYYAKLKNVSGLTAYYYANDLRMLYPTVIDDLNYDALRTQYVNDLPLLRVGTSFRSNILGSFDFIRNIDNKTFAQLESYFEDKLTNISTPPLGMSKLTENEKFALTQLYYSVLNYTKWVYTNPSSSSTGGSCLPSTNSEWKEVARAAFLGGLSNGIRVGIAGVQAGAIAATAAGNPLAGGIIGGIIGFSIGSVSGAFIGAGGQMMWACISNKIFSPRKAYICGGKQYYAYSVSPPAGCLSGYLSPLTSSNAMQGVAGVDLRSVYDYGLVPNKGKTALATSVVKDFNWLLGWVQ
ncbi:MAG: hypothetical protein OEV74_16665 [Cyclobacteriaceae bacterium]|nr:hypothetical protein [Cyclobacteriaceae bacterium]MDH4297913.1 hypothetical protein [Cyclobacteriaceae bacterium]MDH5250265.1 hypothetical protein [Cyclobacteriaceae bacterium]